MKKALGIGIPKKKTTIFFPHFKEEQQSSIEQMTGDPSTPPTSPTVSEDKNSPLSFLNERNEERTRSLQDLYEVTKRLDNLTLLYLFADCELVHFEEIVEEKKWR